MWIGRGAEPPQDLPLTSPRRPAGMVEILTFPGCRQNATAAITTHQSRRE